MPASPPVSSSGVALDIMVPFKLIPAFFIGITRAQLEFYHKLIYIEIWICLKIVNNCRNYD